MIPRQLSPISGGSQWLILSLLTIFCISSTLTSPTNSLLVEGEYNCNYDADGIECNDGENEICPNSEFHCGEGSCISKSWVCDGQSDCSDGRDEADCPEDENETCPSSKFDCGKGKCISKSLVCNGQSDCSDGRDEAGCPDGENELICLSSEFDCGEGRCISKSRVCDGQPDCLFGRDEIDCIEWKNETCPSTTFDCGQGECISESLVCDGRPDCSDRKDEVDCPEKQCESSEWKCETSNICISSDLLCDGYNDCGDSSDEKNCNETGKTSEIEPNPLSTVWKHYNSYMKPFRSGLSIDIELRHSVNIGNSSLVDPDDAHWIQNLTAEYRNFEPTRTMELLIARAIAHYTLPDEFDEEIKRLIELRTRADRFVYFQLDGGDEEVMKSLEWYRTLLKLEEKYNVIKNPSTEPDAITFSRLCIMFPHYSVVVKPSVSFVINDEIVEGFPLEFGGLIPQGRILQEDVRKALITVHLYVLKKASPWIPFRVQQILLKKRIVSGLLSDEKRLKFLQQQMVISLQGKLFATTKNTFDYIKKNNPDNILENIRWDLIDNY